MLRLVGYLRGDFSQAKYQEAEGNRTIIGMQRAFRRDHWTGCGSLATIVLLFVGVSHASLAWFCC